MSRIDAIDLSNLEDLKEFRKYVAIQNKLIVSIINGGLKFTDNIDARVVTAVFNSQDTDTLIQHTLGSTPRGYVIVGSTVALSIYDGTVPPDATQITLKASAAGTARILFF